MTYTPGVDMPWGILKRRSVFNTRLLEDGQRDHYEHSTGWQEEDVHQWLLDHHKGRVVATYTDIASGFKKDAARPSFDNALLDLETGRIRGIAVYRLDRLSRRITEIWAVVRKLEELGAHLISVSEGIDTTDPLKASLNRQMLSMVALAAESESQAISERITWWHAKRARQGEVHRSPHRPFGLTSDWQALNEAEAALLHEAARTLLKMPGRVRTGVPVVAAYAADWQGVWRPVGVRVWSGWAR